MGEEGEWPANISDLCGEFKKCNINQYALLLQKGQIYSCSCIFFKGVHSEKAETKEKFKSKADQTKNIKDDLTYFKLIGASV